jgi:DNA-binding NarL/FixJ family response regulator
MIPAWLRYGALLGLFLVLAEIARRAHLGRLLPVDLYVALVALAFLALGAGAAILLLRRRRERLDATPPARIANGEGFSAREQDVMIFLVHGYTNKEIAEKLAITENTVKTHLKSIYAKLGVTNRTQAAAELKLLRVVETA